MAECKVLSARVPEDLYELAHQAAGRPTSHTELIRIALAQLAGVDVHDHTPPNGGIRPGAGRPRKDHQMT